MNKLNLIEFRAMLHINALGLEVRNMLGEGSFAQVYSCYDHLQNKEYAVKMIKKSSMANSRLRAFFKEAEILEAMNHKNIVNFYSFHQTDQYLLIKMELIRGGTLKKLLEKRKKNRQVFREEEIALFLKNLLEGIRYLHNLNIIHRDLKPENVLFEDDNDLSSVKIVDFGLSAKLEIHNPKNVKVQCGTLLFMAPQIFNKPSYTKSVDIWSCAGRHPFYIPGMKSEDFKMKLKTEYFPPLSEPLAQNFILKISTKQYEQRYNVNEALKHPWITRNKDDQIPLSIHQSYKGFDSANEIITILKLFLTIGTAISHKRTEIDQFYRFKVRDFVRNNQAVRVFSPSRKRVRDKNNELFVKMNQIFHTQKQALLPQQNIEQRKIEERSPTLKKHQSFFSSLFDKEKSFQGFCIADRLQLKKVQTLNLKQIKTDQKEEILFKYQTEREKSQAQRNRSFSDSNNFSDSPISINRQIQLKIQSQIEDSVNSLKMISRGQSSSKRRIFQKKQSFEQQMSDKRLKIMKKYSHNIEIQKLQESVKQNVISIPVAHRQFFNRKSMSPMRNQYSTQYNNQQGKPMIFSVSAKNHHSHITKK